jgi:hypothetical protein
MLGFLLIAVRSAADEPEPLSLNLRVDNEWIVEAEGESKGEPKGLETMVIGNDVRLPIGELAKALELDGSVDASTRRIVIGGRTIPFDAARMTVTENDILAGTALLTEWFAIEVKIDRHASTVTIHSAAPLPFQLRRMRESEAAKTLARSGATLPSIPNPYSLFDGPFVDARIRMTGGGRTASSDFDIFATADLAGLSASAFAAGSANHPLALAWLTLGRRDPDPILLGPLHARQAEVGEVFFNGDDLVALPRRGTGAAISSFPLDHSARFDEQTLTGDLMPGEDVELYVNTALAGYQKGSESGGHYTFTNVPVMYGVNIFRLVFYGAHGQQRVETRRFNVGESLTRKGRFEYRVIAAGNEMAEAAYGVTQHVTATATALSVDLDRGGRHDYLGGGIRASFRGIFGYGDAMRDTQGGTIGRFGMQTRIGQFALSMSRAQLHSFTSEIYRDDLGPIAARTVFHAGGVFGRRYIIPARFDLAVDDLAGGGRVSRAGLSVSSAFGRVWVTSDLQSTTFRNVPRATDADSATGNLRFSRVASDLSLRGEIGYEVRPRREMTSATIAADLRRFRQADLSAAIERDMSTHISRAIVGVRHDAGRYAVAVSVEVPSSGKPTVRVEVSTSVLHNPLAHRFAFNSHPSAAGGAVAANVYLDRNANGVRDDGEPPIAGAGFFVNRGVSPVVTDADGRAFLERLPSDSRNELVLSTSTLDDPGWTPATSGAAFVARAGKPLIVDFPIVVTGEITGTVMRDDRPAPSVCLELLAANGTMIKTTTTAYDGFYNFAAVRPGTYSVRVDGAAPHAITISADHTFESADFSIAGERP